MVLDGKGINLRQSGDCPNGKHGERHPDGHGTALRNGRHISAGCKDQRPLADYRSCRFFRRFQAREPGFEIGQAFTQNRLIARIGAGSQFPLNAGTRQFQALFFAHSFELIGSQLRWSSCFLFPGGGFDLGLDRLTFPASRHNFILRPGAGCRLI